MEQTFTERVVKYSFLAMPVVILLGAIMIGWGLWMALHIDKSPVSSVPSCSVK